MEYKELKNPIMYKDTMKLLYVKCTRSHLALSENLLPLNMI